jgi:hypothetical protein
MWLALLKERADLKLIQRDVGRPQRQPLSRDSIRSLSLTASLQWD